MGGILEIQGKIHFFVFKKRILSECLKGGEEESLKTISKNITKVESQMGILDLLEKFILQKEMLFLVVEDKRVVGVVALEDAINAALGVGNLQRF